MKFDDAAHPPLNVFDALCPSRQTLGQVTARWAPLVLASLSDEPIRFAELRRSVDGVSDRMLSQTLHKLEAGGLVIRDVKSSIPPHVEYHLSEPGLRIAAKIRELIDVVYDELPAIMAFRAANTSQETTA
jgi:DNA-binding HxlR family transcriptional regulator